MDSAWQRLIPAPQIAAAVRGLGARIAADYAGRELTLVGLLRGGLFFLADLARAIPAPVRIDTLQPQSYGAGMTSSGTVVLAGADSLDVGGRDILLVDDIYDSGRTLSRVWADCAAARARSVAAACLVAKDAPRAIEVEVRYRAFTIPNQFVIGCGLDWDGLGRNLPDIWALNSCVSEDAARRELRAKLLGPGKAD